MTLNQLAVSGHFQLSQENSRGNGQPGSGSSSSAETALRREFLRKIAEIRRKRKRRHS